MLTHDTMHAMWPHGDAKIPGLVDAIAAAAATVFPTYGLTSDLLIAHAMAQFSHECGAGSEVVENLNYSAAGLMATWPERFDAAKAAAFAGQPERIANEVYGGRMGNRAGSDDGWTYCGRGGSQVTGREGYTNLGRRLGIDLLANPDLVNQPARFLECAVADFVLCGCLPFAMQDDVNGVTYALNGGYEGKDKRIEWLARWKVALGLRGGGEHGTVWLQQSLNRLGAEPNLAVDGDFGENTAAAVRTFQQTHGLPADGRLTAATAAALERALPA